MEITLKKVNAQKKFNLNIRTIHRYQKTLCLPYDAVWLTLLKKAWGRRCIKTANSLSQSDYTSFLVNILMQYIRKNWDKKSLSWVGQYCKPAARIVGQHWRSKFVVQNYTRSALHWVRFLLPDIRERVTFCDLYWCTLIKNPKLFFNI